MAMLRLPANWQDPRPLCRNRRAERSSREFWPGGLERFSASGSFKTAQLFNRLVAGSTEARHCRARALLERGRLTDRQARSILKDCETILLERDDFSSNHHLALTYIGA